MSKQHVVIPVLIFLLLFTTPFSTRPLAAESPVISSKKTYILYTAQGSPIKEILDARIQEAFSRINLKAKLVIFPSSQRAMMLANEEGDGDAFRVPDLKKIAPEHTTNLIQVPESIIAVELSVFSKNFSFPVTGWHCLDKYHNGARIGAKILEKNIPGKRTFLVTTIQLVQMLDSDRIDTIIEWAPLADNTIRKLKTDSIKKLSPPLKTQSFHIYLHKKHRSLVPLLAEAIRQMKAEGAFGKVADGIL